MRFAALARTVVGSACLLTPDRVLRAIGGQDHADPRVRALARLLGARYLAHAAVDWSLPPSRTTRVGPAVEAAHAASMVLVAFSDRHRRTALVSAAVAGVIATLDLRSSDRHHGS